MKRFCRGRTTLQRIGPQYLIPLLHECADRVLSLERLWALSRKLPKFCHRPLQVVTKIADLSANIREEMDRREDVFTALVMAMNAKHGHPLTAIYRFVNEHFVRDHDFIDRGVHKEWPWTVVGVFAQLCIGQDASASSEPPDGELDPPAHSLMHASGLMVAPSRWRWRWL